MTRKKQNHPGCVKSNLNVIIIYQRQNKKTKIKLMKLKFINKKMRVFLICGLSEIFDYRISYGCTELLNIGTIEK